MRSIVLAATLLLAGCVSSPSPEDYVSVSPDFDLFEFFDGRVTAWGIVQDRSGDVIQRFKVTIDGSVEGDTLTLEEDFRYEVGTGVRERTWVIERGSGGLLTGRAGDIVGAAAGEVRGNALRWRYEMDLPVGGSEYRVSFDDWMWRFEDGSVVNRSWIRKFGITFAEVTLFMQQTPQG